ncbi:hypothetical protein F0358_14005 [Empedobacter brevis]|uniref:hypothetical protein n=1 Tax=Empedobacter brevis TaxID=247 RepID=UPI00123CC3D4|nr:hypothetical protein [Empedobacter brevis]QES93754.1 hypothetical protein F0358_14005 [Empedobacter brevis]
MKKHLIILMSLFSSASLFSQVGINTENPQQLFHTDGKSSAATTNPTTGTPSVAQQVDDVVITNQGRVGIGTINPSIKLDIVSSTNGAIKIVDGTEGQSKVLMSNEYGVGTWQTPASIKAVALGNFSQVDNNVSSNGGSSPLYSKISLNLSRGRWVVNAGLTLLSYLSTANRFWQHFYLSSSTTSVQQNGFTHLGPAGNSTSYAGVMYVTGSSANPPSNDSNMSFISGSSVINVTTDNLTIYLLIENKATNHWLLRGAAFENYFYAIPLN